MNPAAAGRRERPGTPPGPITLTLPTSNNPDTSLLLAFNEVRNALFARLCLLLASHEDAQDTLQVTFVHCWQARGYIPAIHDVRSWILRIGANAAKDLLRNQWRRRRQPTVDLQMFPGRLSCPLENLLEKERQEHLRAAILDLHARERQVFLLRQNCGLTYEEIARLLETPAGTVKTRMRSAIRKLREKLR
ncbi:MAG TPA: RNA polymerase sigma factor [Gemmataceae bacterium]|nr:RNA polymerase sigma factor [Gemmataceae bacterium]